MKATITFTVTSDEPYPEVDSPPATGSYPNGYIFKRKTGGVVAGENLYWVNVGDETTPDWKPSGLIGL